MLDDISKTKKKFCNLQAGKVTMPHGRDRSLFHLTFAVFDQLLNKNKPKAVALESWENWDI